MSLIRLIEEVFLFLEGKREIIDGNHLKALAAGYLAACQRAKELENTRSYLWANKAHPAKIMLKPKREHGKIAIGKN